MVVDEQDKLLGTVTDGDIRRSILNEITPDRAVRDIMNPNPVTAPPTSTRREQLDRMAKAVIHHLPLVDDQQKIVGLVMREQLLETKEVQKPNSVVLLAGGRGERLKPLTDNVPKPLLPIGGRPILETAVSRLVEHGLNQIYLSVNHMSSQVKDHFGNGRQLKADITYLEESSPLGTAGCLGLINDQLDHALLVMNGDIITTIDYTNMLAYHDEQGADITVATRQLAVELPYGIVELDDGVLQSVVEKPTHEFNICAGIYIISPDVISAIEPNKRLDMPELLSSSLATGKRVVGFPMHEYWIDVGRLEDFQRAANEYNDVFA